MDALQIKCRECGWDWLAIVGAAGAILALEKKQGI
jgi:hypothetical protein